MYDLQSDPDEVNNLATSARHADALARLRAAQRAHALAVRDVGFLPEGEIHSRSKFPLERIIAAAELASAAGQSQTPELRRLLADDDSAVRYWAATGLLIRQGPAVRESRDALRACLKDPSPHVRVAAAEAMARYGSDPDPQEPLEVLLELADVKRHGVYVSVAALNALDALDRRAMPLKDKVAALPESDPAIINKMREYVPRLKEAILEDLN